MSGGFFRGTSADQDTRFSNKQAKLMKSQKFAPELEHLVDMTKVKMDVIRPWIANRVTELLGFEDEVLINFIYGLLDKKEVNGKEVQISLTGFMEKNTAKFMKELWTLLLSAHKNASGVPQQFLDAKEEEARKKKAEADRIASEIEKKKDMESRELEEERLKKMDGLVESRAIKSGFESKSKPRDLSGHPEDEEEPNKRNNGVRGRHRDSASRSPSRSISRSLSNPRSFADDRHKSRSVSGSPEARGRSVSAERVYRSPRRRSVTPRRRHSPLRAFSPSRRRFYYSRRRSRSRSPYRSPSPVRRRLRSPYRRRSPSPMRRRRSPSPIRRRRPPSPIRHHRSPSPIRRRRSPSPVRRRRSPSPIQRRSPSPVQRRSFSPIRRRSPSPVRRRSPSPPQQASLSPARRRYRRSPTPQRSSLLRRRSPIPGRRRSLTPPLRRRSPSPNRSSSPSPVQRTSPFPIRRNSPTHHRSPVRSPRERTRTHEKLSPLARRSSSSLRSPRKDPRDQGDSRDKVSVSMSSQDKSPSLSESPPRARNRVPSEDRRSYSPYQSPVRQTGKRMSRDSSFSPARKPYHDSLEIIVEGEGPGYAREDVDEKSKAFQKRSTHSSALKEQKGPPLKDDYKEGHSPKRLADRRVTESQVRSDSMELRRKEQEIKSEKYSRRGVPPESPAQHKSPIMYKDSLLGDGLHPSYPGEGKMSDEKNRSRLNNVDSSQRHSETVQDSVGKVDRDKQTAPYDSSSEESDKHKNEEKKSRKHKRSERKGVDSDDDDSYDSEQEDRKEAKRKRRKEEKKLRKEEKRRRREERRRRKEERRAEKLKLKNHVDVYASEGEETVRRASHPSDDEEMQAEQRKLEIELRKKALESLKAKKGISQ